MAFILKQRLTPAGQWGCILFVVAPLVSGFVWSKYAELLMSPRNYSVSNDLGLYGAMLMVLGFLSLCSIPMMLLGREQVMRQVPDSELDAEEASHAE